MITEITSSANEAFKLWKTLDTGKSIRKNGIFFLMGEKLIREFLKTPTAPGHSRFTIHAEVISEDHTALTTAPTFKLSKGLFHEVDFVGTKFNLLLLTLPEIPLFQAENKPEGLELLCPLGDPGNLGAVMRSALAFHARCVILTEEAAFPFSPKSVKASAGAVLRIPLYRAPKLSTLPLAETYALDMVGSDISGFPWPKNLRLLIGEEGPGLSHLKGLMKLKINTGPVESLNATVAASIALFSYQQWNQTKRGAR
jgi:TrmH family RNA methyltransferase